MPSVVPYSGSPSVAPEDRPIPTEQVSTPLAAFGGDTAAALEHLGGVSQGAGNELYARAIAMQETYEQAKASAAVADFSNAAGQRYNDFTSLAGGAAVAGYKPFLSGVQDDRAKFRNGLDSPYAQRLYDQESRSMAGRLSISAGAHAGEQNKQFLIGAAKAQTAAATSQIGLAPQDNDIAAANIAAIRAHVTFEAQQRGLSPEATQLQVQEAISSAASARIGALVRTQPFVAKSLLDSYSKDGTLTGTDAARMGDLVQKEQWTVGGRQIASGIQSGGDNRFGAGIIDIERAAAAIRSIESGSAKGNYSLIHPPAKNGDYALGAYGIMHSNLQGWLREAGLGPMTDQEFLANHSAQDAVFKDQFQRAQQRYGSANAAANVWFSGHPNVDPNPAHGDGHTTQPQYQAKFNAALAQTAGLRELVDKSRARAEELSPGDGILADAAVSHTEQLFNQRQKIERDEEFDARSTIEGALVTGLQNGQIPTTVQELQADPKVAAAWERMSSVDQRKYMGVLSRNARGDVAMTPERLQTYGRLYGEAINEPDKFLQEDVTAADIPLSKRAELLKMQAQVYKKADADPQTSGALSKLGPMIQASGLARSDKQSYAQFTGALHDELVQFQSDNKRPPDYQELQVIGARLLQRHGSTWYSSGTPFFQTEVPSEAADLIRNDPSWGRLGIVPQDEDIRRVYLRKQYQTLYGARTPAPAGRAPAAQPTVPHSE